MKASAVIYPRSCLAAAARRLLSESQLANPRLPRCLYQCSNPPACCSPSGSQVPDREPHSHTPLAELQSRSRMQHAFQMESRTPSLLQSCIHAYNIRASLNTQSMIG